MCQLDTVFGEFLEEAEGGIDDQTSFSDAAYKDALVEGFKRGMRGLAGGVCAVTVRDGGSIVGVTATSVTSLSMEPPSLLVSIRKSSSLLASLRRARRFTVHILAEGQTREADAFAGRLGTAPRETLVEWEPSTGECQRLARSTYHIDCRAMRFIPLFSHAIVVGVVSGVETGPAKAPLVYFDGRYHQIARAD
ncbi:flavin reductase family protein [Methylocapsa sp. S129]|uniref:flavin reductase family protein n=1 Tax=Methylocapsa sp. S129 TaxID=1641869 RepID=UPI00131B4CDB|nr:flavin reductase family protein [Methylocapsa sp. S129]